MRSNSLGINFSVLLIIASLSAIIRPVRNAYTSRLSRTKLSRDQIDGESEADVETTATPYAFGYQIKDGEGNLQHRMEKSGKNGAKHGSYGYVDPNGVYRRVDYVADEKGYRVKMKNQQLRETEDDSRANLVKKKPSVYARGGYDAQESDPNDFTRLGPSGRNTLAELKDNLPDITKNPKIPRYHMFSGSSSEFNPYVSYINKQGSNQRMGHTTKLYNVYRTPELPYKKSKNDQDEDPEEGDAEKQVATTTPAPPPRPRSRPPPLRQKSANRDHSHQEAESRPQKGSHEPETRNETFSREDAESKEGGTHRRKYDKLNRLKDAFSMSKSKVPQKSSARQGFHKSKDTQETKPRKKNPWPLIERKQHEPDIKRQKGFQNRREYSAQLIRDEPRSRGPQSDTFLRRPDTAPVRRGLYKSKSADITAQATIPKPLKLAKYMHPLPPQVIYTGDAPFGGRLIESQFRKSNLLTADSSLQSNEALAPSLLPTQSEKHQQLAKKQNALSLDVNQEARDKITSTSHPTKENLIESKEPYSFDRLRDYATTSPFDTNYMPPYPPTKRPSNRPMFSLKSPELHQIHSQRRLLKKVYRKQPYSDIHHNYTPPAGHNHPRPLYQERKDLMMTPSVHYAEEAPVVRKEIQSDPKPNVERKLLPHFRKDYFEGIREGGYYRPPLGQPIKSTPSPTWLNEPPSEAQSFPFKANTGSRSQEDKALVSGKVKATDKLAGLPALPEYLPRAKHKYAFIERY